MERMMGVRESLTDPPPPSGAGGRLRDLASLMRMIVPHDARGGQAAP